jgi:hypothetical protein
MGAKMRRSLVAVACFLLLSAFASPARADDGGVTQVTLAADTNFGPDVTTLLISYTFSAAAGESRHIKGRLEATSSTTVIVAMDNIVKCVDSSGAQVGIVSASSRNHEGSDTTYYATPGHLPIYADLLFTAPSAGTYTCGVYGWTAAGSPLTYHLTAVHGMTWMQVSNADQPGAHWWQNPICNSTGTSSTCSYIGAGTNSKYVFYNDGTTVFKWTPQPGAVAVQALANAEVTTCYTGTASCSGVSGYEHPRGTDSVLDYHLEFIQLDPTSHTCRNTMTTSGRANIRDDAHHYVVYMSLPRVTIDPTCGTSLFIMRVYLAWVSGNPMKIDGVQGSTSLTNGIAMSLFS